MKGMLPDGFSPLPEPVRQEGFDARTGRDPNEDGGAPPPKPMGGPPAGTRGHRPVVVEATRMCCAL